MNYRHVLFNSASMITSSTRGPAPGIGHGQLLLPYYTLALVTTTTHSLPTYGSPPQTTARDWSAPVAPTPSAFATVPASTGGIPSAMSSSSILLLSSGGVLLSMGGGVVPVVGVSFSRIVTHSPWGVATLLLPGVVRMSMSPLGFPMLSYARRFAGVASGAGR